MSALIKYHPVDIEVTGLVEGSFTALFACSIRCGANFVRILFNRVVILFVWTLLRRPLGTVHACLVANNIAVGHVTLGSALGLGEPRHALRVLRPAIRGVAG